jgi:hypothetical protein
MLMLCSRLSGASTMMRSDAKVEKLYLYSKRAAAIISLIQSAGMNGHDPYAYLKKDVLTRLPTQRVSE